MFNFIMRGISAGRIETELFIELADFAASTRDRRAIAGTIMLDAKPMIDTGFAIGEPVASVTARLMITWLVCTGQIEEEHKAAAFETIFR